MKPVIVDTNILFSALLGKSKKIRDIVLYSNDFKLFTCKFAVVELFKYQKTIQEKSALQEDEIVELLYGLLKRIHIVDEMNVSNESIKKAYDLCHDVDKKDIPFVSITIELDGLFWTKDKTLKEKLIQKGFLSFFELDSSSIP